jgi:hypothetical protein
MASPPSPTPPRPEPLSLSFHPPTNAPTGVDQLYAALTHRLPRFPPAPRGAAPPPDRAPPTHFRAPPTPLPKGLRQDTLSPSLCTILSQLVSAFQFLLNTDLSPQTHAHLRHAAKPVPSKRCRHVCATPRSCTC